MNSKIEKQQFANNLEVCLKSSCTAVYKFVALPCCWLVLWK